MAFVRGPNPIWFYANLVGQPVDDTYFAFFLTNTLPYVPQAVYQDPNGTIPWSDPIEFQPSSGLPNNIYFNPDLVYRIEIRQGPTQADPLIYLIEDYTVGTGGSGTTTRDALITSENILTNPQFADINFVSPLTITTSGTHDIAPGWELVLTGTGSTTITQNQPSGDENNFGNPPYSLTFLNSGWTSVELVQRFTNNGAIFGGSNEIGLTTGAIAAAVTGYAGGATPIPLTVVYAPSDAGTQQNIFDNVLINPSPYNHHEAAIDIVQSTNSDSGSSAYVEIKYVLPSTGEMTLTNLQITGQSTPLSSDFTQNDAPVFQETTYERIVDHEFHVYKDSLLTQPKDNILSGWTFALNPWQFRTVSSTNVSNTQFYTADQTIVIQQNVVATNTGNNVAVGRATAANNYAFQVTAVTATNKFAIIQYIDSSTIRPYWGQILSAFVRLHVSSPTHNTTPKFKMRLIYRTTAVPTIAQTEPIATWTSGNSPGNEPVFAAGWTAIAPLNDPEYTISALSQGFSFNQFQLSDATTDTMFLGVVIYTTTNMDQTATADSILFDRVSLVPNDFAIDASTETFDQTLIKCQFYYEKSYNIETLPGTTNAIGYSTCQIASATGEFFGLNTRYKVYKRITPSIIWYSPVTGAIDNVRKNGGADIPVVNTFATGTSTTGYPTGAAQIDTDSIFGHWVADVRLGI